MIVPFFFPFYHDPHSTFALELTNGVQSSAVQSVVQSSDPPSTSSAAAQTTFQTSSSQTSSASSSWTPTPITSVQTMTVSGVVVTQTVTSMSTPPPTLLESQKKSSSAGTIAGAVVGALAGLALVGAFLFWFLFWRRRNQNENQAESSAGTSRSPPRRNTSTLSRTGLLKSERDVLPPVVTATSRNSRNLDYLDHESISPISERRNSRPLYYDQRLNPSALMVHDNGSHSSFMTMEDNRDYTRTLNVSRYSPMQFIGVIGY